MTDAVDVEVEDEDAGSELLASAIVVMLLLLRMRAHYRRMTSAHLDEMAAQARALVARADLGVVPVAFRARMTSRLIADLDDLIDRYYSALLRLLQAELVALARTLAEAGTRQINQAVGAEVASRPTDTRVSAVMV